MGTQKVNKTAGAVKCRSEKPFWSVGSGTRAGERLPRGWRGGGRWGTKSHPRSARSARPAERPARCGHEARSATGLRAPQALRCRHAAGAGREGCRDASSDREGPVVPRHGVRTALRRPRVTDSETQRASWECGDSEQRRRRRRRTAVHGGTGPRWARRARPLVEMLSFVKESQNSGFSREIA